MLYINHVHFYILFILSISTFIQTCCPSLQHIFEKAEIEEKVILDSAYSSPNYCDHSLIAPKLVINPYKKEIENHVQHKPFGSFCLKCAACIAIADEVSNILRDAEEKSKSEVIESSTDVTSRINELCNTGFKNYDLRKYNKVSLITDRLRCTQHLNTILDGGWTKKLRELCNLYTYYMDVENIVRNFVNDTHLTQMMCSGNGIFRDCQNLEINGVVESLTELRDCANCECCRA